MRILVCGGRDYRDPRPLWAKLDAINALTPISLIIEGGQRSRDPQTKRLIGGADYWAWWWADYRHVPVITDAAAWDDLNAPGAIIKYNRFGKPYNAKAGMDRNQSMLDKHKPDRVVAAPGANGTADMMRRARAAGIEVVEVT